MSSIYVADDMHGDPISLTNENSQYHRDMKDGQDNDFVIICGDFGLIWSSPTKSKFDIV